MLPQPFHYLCTNAHATAGLSVTTLHHLRQVLCVTMHASVRPLSPVFVLDVSVLLLLVH